MLVISQNITSTMRSSVRTRPYMAPAKASRLAANMPTPGLTRFFRALPAVAVAPAVPWELLAPLELLAPASFVVSAKYQRQ